MKIILHGNPLSTQHLYRYTCRGSFPTCYMTKDGKSLKEAYQFEAKSQYRGEMIVGNCNMEIMLFFKDKRKRDIDNFNKLILDSLEGIIYKDDRQIQRLIIDKKLSAKDPRIEVKIVKTK